MIKLKKNITIEEQQEFIDKVFNNTFVTLTSPNYLKLEDSFETEFYSMFTNTTKEPATNSMDLECAELKTKLRRIINQQVDFENAKLIALHTTNHEAVEVVAATFEKAQDVTEKLLGILDSLKDMVEKGKPTLLKKLKALKIEDVVEKLKGTLGDEDGESNK